jgi:hypothetical protein
VIGRPITKRNTGGEKRYNYGDCIFILSKSIEPNIDNLKRLLFCQGFGRILETGGKKR